MYSMEVCVSTVSIIVGDDALGVPPLHVLCKNISNIALKYNYSTILSILQYICITAPENFQMRRYMGDYNISTLYYKAPK